MMTAFNKVWLGLIALFVLCAIMGMSASAGGVQPLRIEESVAWDATDVAIITYEDLTETTTNVAQTISDVMTVAAKQGLELVAAVLVTPFTDTATNAFASVAVTVGDGTDADLYLTSMELNSYGTEVYLQYGRTVWNSGTTNNVTLSYGRKLYTAADTIDFVFTPTTGYALSALDAGEVRFYFRRFRAQ